MRPVTRAVLLPVALAMCAGCSDGTLPPSRSPEDPSSPSAAEAQGSLPSTTAGAPAAPATTGTMPPMHHHEAPPTAPIDAGAGSAR